MEPPPLIPERGEQFLPPPEGSSTFLDALIRSATHSEAQVFTEATPPFKICHANNAWSLLCGYSVPDARSWAPRPVQPRFCTAAKRNGRFWPQRPP